MKKLTLINDEFDGDFYNVFYKGNYFGVTIYSPVNGWVFTGSGGSRKYVCEPYKTVSELKYIVTRMYYERLNL